MPREIAVALQCLNVLLQMLNREEAKAFWGLPFDTIHPLHAGVEVFGRIDRGP